MSGEMIRQHRAEVVARISFRRRIFAAMRHPSTPDVPASRTVSRARTAAIPAAVVLMGVLLSGTLLAQSTPGVAPGAANGVALLAFGFLFGLKHALDADHLVAVSTIVSERSSPWSATLVGGLWGLGHTASLIVAGVLIVVLRLEVPEQLAAWLEFGVAVMIAGLGANLLRKLLGNDGCRVTMAEHSHGTLSHRHPHLAYAAETPGATSENGTSGLHRSWRGIGRKPFLVGMMHGLAGSAALMLLVLSEIRSPRLGLLYILVFGVGSIGGMLVMSTLFSLPYLLLKNRFRAIDRGLRLSAGALSVAFGIYLMYEIGIIDGLFARTF